MRTVALAILAVVAACSASAQDTAPVDAQLVSGAKTRNVDVTILLDASTSMSRAWSQCVRVFPVLLSSLVEGDTIRVVVFGEDAQVALDQAIHGPQDVDSVSERLAAIKCERKGSKMSAGLSKVLTTWGRVPETAVFICISDGIVYPKSGSAHDAEWAARWREAKPIRQSASLQRVLMGAHTEEPDDSSLQELQKVLIPTQSLTLDRDSLEQLQAFMQGLHKLVDDIRVAQPVTIQPAPEGPKGRTWQICVAVLAAAVLLTVIGAALKRSHRTDGDVVSPPVGILSVTAWTLDATALRRVGEPQRWSFDVPARGAVAVKLGGERNGPDLDCRIRSTDLLGDDPVSIVVDATGIREVVVPPFGWAMIKDERPAANSRPRCLEEELYHDISTESVPRTHRPMGNDLLLRLPGTNEVRAQFAALASGDPMHEATPGGGVRQSAAPGRSPQQDSAPRAGSLPRLPHV